MCILACLYENSDQALNVSIGNFTRKSKKVLMLTLLNLSANDKMG